MEVYGLFTITQIDILVYRNPASDMRPSGERGLKPGGNRARKTLGG